MKTLNLLIGIILLLVVIIFMLWTPKSNTVLFNASPGYADVNVQGVQGWNPVHPYTHMVAPGHLSIYGGNVHRFGHVGGFGRHVGHGRR